MVQLLRFWLLDQKVPGATLLAAAVVPSEKFKHFLAV